MTEVLQLLAVVFQVLGPIAERMIAEAMAGRDPLAVLAAEHVDAIISDPLKLEIAEKAARARLAVGAK